MSNKIYEVIYKLNDKIYKELLSTKQIENMLINGYKVITIIDIKEI